MNKKTMTAANINEELFTRYPVLEACRDDIYEAFLLLKDTYLKQGMLLVAGNGGSAADSEHIVGELMKSFKFGRAIPAEDAAKLKDLYGDEGAELAAKLEGALPAIPLTSMPALSTAFMNDVDPSLTFAQMLYGYGRKGDTFIGISTSGNSENIIKSLQIAKLKGVKTIGLTGASGGRMKALCDVAVCVPETETFKIQELHLPIYHCLCAMLEAEFFDEK
ncbi:MAG: SIS domain-containing protein [Eubacteriales bacterium]|nr:SIS domain-containing protein [Eubacteriales bacterium]